MKFLVLLFFAAALSAGPGRAGNAGSDPVQPLANAGNAFGFDLLAQILKQDAGKNLFISPYSISTCLAMACSGAGDTTRAAMTKVLHLDAMTPTDINQGNAGLKEALRSADPKVILETANSLWTRKGFALKDEFLKSSSEEYGATARELDFDSPDAAAAINKWVKDSTQDKIDSIVDKLDRTDMLLLLNAVYFKGTWTSVFDERLTHDGPFTAGSGGQKTVPLMHNSGHYDYFEDETVQSIRLPYGTGRLGMVILLPRKDVPLERLESELNLKTWGEWTQRLHPAVGNITLPRFKMSYEINLNQALKTLGMGPAFDPNAADFSGMSNTAHLHISEVMHKTFLEVNELGTEAAAVTGVRMGMKAFVPRRFIMVVDHPFLCAIADKQTGAILFLGAIQDPA